MQIVTLEPVEVMYVQAAEDSPKYIQSAFSQLESKVGLLRGRKFYGVIDSKWYRACVKLEEKDSPSKLGLDTFTVEGGKYAKETIPDWEKNESRIRPTSQSMAQKYTRDESRPKIEFYRSQKELILFLPVK